MIKKKIITIFVFITTILFTNCWYIESNVNYVTVEIDNEDITTLGFTFTSGRMYIDNDGVIDQYGYYSYEEEVVDLELDSNIIRGTISDLGGWEDAEKFYIIVEIFENEVLVGIGNVLIEIDGFTDDTIDDEIEYETNISIYFGENIVIGTVIYEVVFT
jgi:hypothetical protein